MLHAGETIIVDADALIAVFDPTDVHAQRAFSVLKQIDAVGATLLYPATAIAEAVTTFQRKLNNQQAVAHIIQRIKQKDFFIEQIDQATIHVATGLFHPTGSKQNTLFDAIVAAVAKRHQATTVFSFDGWYKQMGLTLAGDLL
jgi:predicted nucleic acid-binding protein